MGNINLPTDTCKYPRCTRDALIGGVYCRRHSGGTSRSFLLRTAIIIAFIFISMMSCVLFGQRSYQFSGGSLNDPGVTFCLQEDGDVTKITLNAQVIEHNESSSFSAIWNYEFWQVKIGNTDEYMPNDFITALAVSNEYLSHQAKYQLLSIKDELWINYFGWAKCLIKVSEEGYLTVVYFGKGTFKTFTSQIDIGTTEGEFDAFQECVNMTLVYFWDNYVSEKEKEMKAKLLLRQSHGPVYLNGRWVD